MTAPSSFTFTMSGLSVGTHTIQVKDVTNGVLSNVVDVVVNAASSPSSGVSASALLVSTAGKVYGISGGTYPLASAFPTLLSSNSSLTVAEGGTTPLTLTQPVQGGDQIVGAFQALQSSAYTYTALVQADISNTPHCNAGISLRNSSTGFITNLLIELDTNGVGIAQYSSPTDYDSSFGTASNAFTPAQPTALRIVWDGTNYTLLASQTGAASSWVEIGQATAAVCGSPNEIGFFIDNFAVSGGSTGTLVVYDWEATAGVNLQTASAGQITPNATPTFATAGSASGVPTTGSQYYPLAAGTYTLTNGNGAYVGLWNGSGYDSITEVLNASGPLPPLAPLLAASGYQVRLSTDSAGKNVFWTSANITITASSTSVTQGYYFGPVGEKTATLAGLPTTAVAGQALSPSGSYTISGGNAFGIQGYVGLWNRTRQAYDQANLYLGSPSPQLIPLTAASGPLTGVAFNNFNYNYGSGWYNSDALSVDPWSGGGAYTVRICADSQGRYVLAESPVITVTVPALASTTSIYPAALLMAPGNGKTITVGPGKSLPTITNAMEMIASDVINAGSAAKSQYWDCVIEVYTAPSGYYLDDNSTGSNSNSLTFYDVPGAVNGGQWHGQLPNLPITIRGVLDSSGNRPHFTWDGNGEYYDKGYWIPAGGSLTVENIYFTGNSTATTAGSANIPFINFGSSWGQTLVLNNVLIEYSSNSLVGGNPGNALYMRNCELRFCGASDSSGETHEIYVGQIRYLEITDSCFHELGPDCTGHLLKSRAQEVHVTRTRLLDSQTGNGCSYCVDVSEAGLVTLTDCVLYHGPGAANGPMINWGSDADNPSNTQGFIDGATWQPFGITLNNVWMFTQVPSSDSFAGVLGLHQSSFLDGRMGPTPTLTNVYEYGISQGTGWFFEGMIAGTNYVSGMVSGGMLSDSLYSLSSVPTLDYSSPPATGTSDPTTSMPTSTTAVTTAVTGGSIVTPTGVLAGQFTALSVSTTGGSAGWVSLTGPNGEELPRVFINAGTAYCLPQTVGSYTANLYGAASGGSPVASSGSFAAGMPTPSLLTPPANLTLVGAYGEVLVFSCSYISGNVGNAIYTLGYQTGTGAWQTVNGIYNNEGNAVLFYVYGLTPSTSYQITAFVTDNRGPGQQTAYLSATTATSTANFTTDTKGHSFNISWDNGEPSSGYSGTNGTNYGGSLDKVAVTTNGPDPILIFSLSSVDPSYNNSGFYTFSTLTEYSSTVYYNNNLYAGPGSGKTSYAWVICSDGSCYTDGIACVFN